MATTRMATQAARIEELERALSGLDLSQQEQAQELAQLRIQAAADARSGTLLPPLPPADGANRPVGVMTHLRPPSIDRFSGDRERSLDFILAIDRRLHATARHSSRIGVRCRTPAGLCCYLVAMLLLAAPRGAILRSP